MANTYTPQKKSNADTLAYVRQHIDSAATAVDPTTNKVTTPTVWSQSDKNDWLMYTSSMECCEILEGTE